MSANVSTSTTKRSRKPSAGDRARNLVIFAFVWVMGLIVPALILWVFQEATAKDYWHPWPAMAAMGLWWCVVMFLLAAGAAWKRRVTLPKRTRVAIGIVVAVTGVATVIYYVALSGGSAGYAVGLLILLGTGAVLLGGVVDLSLGPWEERYDSRHVTP